MKQYRLKITWSNGQSEYVGSKCLEKEREDNLLAYATMIENMNCLVNDNKIYALEHVRKFEYEEYIPEKEVKF
jgi:hypothetical protein